MKLSEAILLGSVGSKQGFGVTSAYKENIDKCAIGAALLAVDDEASLDDRDVSMINPYGRLIRNWPWVMNKVLCLDGIPTSVYCFSKAGIDIIWMLNDTARWTRPRIATWVATVEPQEVITNQPITEEVECETK